MRKNYLVAFAVSAALAAGAGLAGCGTDSNAGAPDATSGADTSAVVEVASEEPAAEEPAAEEPAAEAVEASGAEELSDAYVSVAWLKDNLDAVTVVDARAATSYTAEHIPGAVSLTWQATSNVMDVAQGEAGWAEIDDPATLREMALAAGIDPAKPVVVYTKVSDGWGEDGRIAWELGEAGYADVKILDGGWTKWVGGGNPTENGRIDNTPAEPLEDSGTADDADPIEQVDTAYVKDHMDEAILVDARLDAEYNSELSMGEACMGRIPNAVSVPNVALFNRDGTIKTVKELTDILATAGVTDKNAEIITYCTGGVRGANVAEVLSALGYTDVKVYTAGFSEWAGTGEDVENQVDLPTEDAA